MNTLHKIPEQRLGFKTLVLAIEINGKRCYYKGAVILLAQDATSQRRRRYEEEVPRIRVGKYLALHIGNPSICKTPS